MEHALHPPLQVRGHDRLRHPVGDGGHPEHTRACGTARLGDLHRHDRRRALYLEPPDLDAGRRQPSLAELKQAMADAHPDRGGTDAEFIAGRDYSARAADYHREQVAVVERIGEIAAPYFAQLPEGARIGAVLELASDADRAEITRLMELAAPDGTIVRTVNGQD